MKCEYCGYPYAYIKYTSDYRYSYIDCPNCKHTTNFRFVEERR